MSWKIDYNYIQKQNNESNAHNFLMASNNICANTMQKRASFCDAKTDLSKNEIAFLNLISEFSSQNGKKIRSCCKLPELHLNLQQFVLAKLEDKVDQYLVDNPSDKAFKEKWKSLRVALAHLLYRMEPQTKSKLGECLNFVQEQLEQIGQEIPTKLRNQDAQIWKLFFEMLNKNVHLMEVPMALLAGISYIKIDRQYGLKTFSRPVFEANNFLIKRMQRNLPWVLHHCETKLEPFSNHSNEQIKELIKALLEKLTECRKIVLPMLT